MNEIERAKQIKVLLSLASVDDDIHPYEIRFLTKFIKSHFSEEVARELIGEITNPKRSYLSVFKTIDNFYHRGATLELARSLLHMDKKFTPEEKIAFDLLSQAHREMSGDLIETQKNAIIEYLKAENEKDYNKETASVIKLLSQRFHYQYSFSFGFLFFRLAYLISRFFRRRSRLAFVIGLILAVWMLVLMVERMILSEYIKKAFAVN
ncbi:hypothetical protein ABMA79_02325 [Halobacteriovorax sp. HFRX-2_2]|uniref:hypothetical protein n=1 Tax=unclassified Halobacteriovorax TaxID=2639665 RepID=UPI0037231B62